MNIGEAARQTHLPAKTIRYYEDIKLVDPKRLENGYRDYSCRDVNILRFLQRARGLGFTIIDCRSILALYQDRHRAREGGEADILKRIVDIDRKTQELVSMRAMLKNLADHYHRNNRPNYPIIEDFTRVP